MFTTALERYGSHVSVASSASYSESSTHSVPQSGRSEVEHSYKADSRLSSEGIDYARQLKNYIVEKRKALMLRRKMSGDIAKEREIVVRYLIASKKLLAHLQQ